MQLTPVALIGASAVQPLPIPCNVAEVTVSNRDRFHGRTPEHVSESARLDRQIRLVFFLARLTDLVNRRAHVGFITSAWRSHRNQPEIVVHLGDARSVRCRALRGSCVFTRTTERDF